MPFNLPNTTSVGQRGEEYVCQRLIERGMEILDRNVHTRFAEIDIIAKDKETLCFVEVRTRTDRSLGHPCETVTAAKQNTIRKAASLYLAKNTVMPCEVRFDVATIIWSDMEFEYFQNAF